MNEGNRTPLQNQIKCSQIGWVHHSPADHPDVHCGHRYDLAVHKGVEPLPRGRQPRILTVILMDFIVTTPLVVPLPYP